MFFFNLSLYPLFLSPYSFFRPSFTPLSSRFIPTRDEVDAGLPPPSLSLSSYLCYPVSSYFFSFYFYISFYRLISLRPFTFLIVNFLISPTLSLSPYRFSYLSILSLISPIPFLSILSFSQLIAFLMSLSVLLSLLPFYLSIFSYHPIPFPISPSPFLSLYSLLFTSFHIYSPFLIYLPISILFYPSIPNHFLLYLSVPFLFSPTIF